MTKLPLDTLIERSFQRNEKKSDESSKRGKGSKILPGKLLQGCQLPAGPL